MDTTGGPRASPQGLESHYCHVVCAGARAHQGHTWASLRGTPVGVQDAADWGAARSLPPSVRLVLSPCPASTASRAPGPLSGQWLPACLQVRSEDIRPGGPHFCAGAPGLCLSGWSCNSKCGASSRFVPCGPNPPLRPPSAAFWGLLARMRAVARLWASLSPGHSQHHLHRLCHPSRLPSAAPAHPSPNQAGFLGLGHSQAVHGAGQKGTCGGR